VPADYLTYLAKTGATHIHPLGKPATESLVAALAPRAGERLLEVGCGTAATAIRIALQRDVCIDGIDLLPAMLHAGRRRIRLGGVASRVSLVRASAAALPLPSASYDAVYSESALGFQDAVTAQAILQEIRRVLKPGGRYVANEGIWKPGTDPATVSGIYTAAVAHFGLSQASPQPWSVEDWLDVIKRSGFEVDKAGLLAERVNAATTPFRQPWRLRLTAALTTFYRLRTLVSPRLLRQGWRYRRLLARHAQDGRYLESWLFVLRVPPARSRGE
jgi:SAM-dependent methyltransferase